MKEGTIDELEQYIAKVTQEARQQRLQDRSVSLGTLVGKLCVSAEGGAKMLHQNQ